MALHDNFVDLAARLINKNGRSVTLTQTTITPDPTEPWKILTTTGTTATVKAVFFLNEQSDFLAILTQVAGRGDQEVTQALGEKSLQVLIAAKGLPFVPTPTDTLVDGDNTWEITRVNPTKPGPTPVMYELQVSR
jgi:hypothetical protein